MKTYLIQQSVDVNICYQIEANSLEEANEKVYRGEYTREHIVDICENWDTPWDVSESEPWIEPMTKEEIQKWSILGL